MVHKYFRNPESAKVLGLLQGGTQDHLIPAGWQECSADEAVLIASAQEVHANLNPPPAPPPVPQDISRAQGRLALYRAGMWPAVQAFVASITDPGEQFEADAALNHTTDWQRSSPFLNRAALALGLSDRQLDDLFRQAAAIVP